MTKNLTREQIEELSFAATAAVVAGTLLTTAVWSAHKNNYGRATFYAVLWAGYTNNTNRALQERKREKKKKVSNMNFFLESPEVK